LHLIVTQQKYICINQQYNHDTMLSTVTQTEKFCSKICSTFGYADTLAQIYALNTE